MNSSCDYVEICVSGGGTEQIPRVIGKYKYLETIGAGSYSFVTLVQHMKTGQKFACKVVSRAMLTEMGVLGRFEQELRLLSSFNHPNIIKTYDIYYTTEKIYIIMEYCKNGDLASYTNYIQVLPDNQIRTILYQSLSALMYLHSLNIEHRDIKLENILIDETFTIKLCDFGISRENAGNQLLQTFCGSPLYIAPEVISGKAYDGTKADIWSLGVAIYSIAVGHKPFEDKSEAGLYKKITKAPVMYPPTILPELKSIIEKMLNKDPSQRQTAAELLTNPWLVERENQYSCVMLNKRLMPSSKQRESSRSTKSVKKLFIKPSISLPNYAQRKIFVKTKIQIRP